MVACVLQPRMHEFFGLGTTHFTEVDEDTGVKEVLKLRVHSLLIKPQNGQACVFCKEFMRDDTWLPQDGVGRPVFKEDVDLDTSSLQAMPTKPVSGFADVEKRLQVGYSINLNDASAHIDMTMRKHKYLSCATGQYQALARVAREHCGSARSCKLQRQQQAKESHSRKSHRLLASRAGGQA